MAPPSAMRFQLLSYSAIMREPLPPIVYDVEPLIVSGTRAVLFAEFGTMKSWLALDLGLHLAAGVPWLGKFNVATAKRVLYVDEEMSKSELWRRVKRLGMGLNEAIHDDLPFRALSHPDLRLANDPRNDAKKLIAAIDVQKFDPEVIIIDSLRRVLVGSENEAEAVGDFWRNVEPLFDGGRRTVIVIHHMKKPSPQAHTHARDRASGSTDILAVPDAAFALSSAAQDAVRVENVKARHSEEHPPFIVSLNDTPPDSPVVMRYEGSAADFAGATSATARAVELAEQFLAEAPDRTARTAEIEGALVQQGITKRTAQRALELLGPRVEKRKRGVYRLRNAEALKVLRGPAEP